MTTGGPPMPATTFMAPLIPPAVTAPAGPGGRCRLQPVATRRVAARQTAPAATVNTWRSAWRATKPKATDATTAGASNRATSDQRTRRSPPTRRTRLRAADSTRFHSTPRGAAAAATRNGADTRENPKPVTAWATAPIATAAAARARWGLSAQSTNVIVMNVLWGLAE